MTKKDSRKAAEQPPRPRPSKSAELDLKIESLAYGGAGVARHENFVLFVPFTAPGDTVRAVVTKRKSNWGEARARELLVASPDRVEAPCPLFMTCGGCTWQHLPIEAQLRAKAQIVADSIRHIPGAESVELLPIAPSPDTWRYRNKMEFTFGTDRMTGDLVSGFHMPGDWRNILDVEHCWLAPETVERVLRAAVAEGKRQGLSAWNPNIHRGTLRQLIVRHSVTQDALIAVLLTGDREKIDFQKFAAALQAAEPTLKGIGWGINSAVSDIARAEVMVDSVGELALEETLGALSFRISPASFFQSNSRGASVLYDAVVEMAELTGRETLLDAYCGTGTIGQYCAKKVRTVYGLELITEAVWDARENAARNGLDNCTFVAGDIRHTLPSLMNSIESRIDRLIVDPPRGGMEKKALEQLLALRAPLIVYVSCNPTTMARDMMQAHEAGYRLEAVRPVDMFPQTYHVECVARLRLAPAPTTEA